MSSLFDFDKGNSKISKEVFESVFDSIPFAVFIVSNRRIIYSSKAAETIFGWRPSELKEKSISMLYRANNEFEEIGKRIYSRIDNENVVSEIYPAKHKSGKDILVNITICKLNGGGKMDIVAIYEDVTERIKAERELQENEEKYRGFIENTHDILFSMTIDGKILNGNNAWHEAFGYDKKEIHSLDISKMVGEQSLESVIKVLEKVGKNEPVLNEEMNFISKDGKEIIIVGNFIPRIFYEKVVSIGCFCHNLTETRRIEQEIKDKISELERFKRLTVDRELKMIELKEKLNDYKEKIEYLQRNNN